MINQKGLTFLEVVVSVGILSVVMMGVGSFQVYQKVQLQDLVLQDMQSSFIDEVENLLSSTNTCTSYLPNTAVNLSVGSKFLMDSNQINSKIPNYYLKIKQVEVEILSSDPIAQDKTATNSSIFNAIATVELEHLSSSRDHLLKNNIIPIKLYGNHNSSNLRDMSCINTNSDSAVYIGQICNAYGGLMSDGVHCDIPKSKALSAHTHAATLPVSPIDVSTDQVKRISLSEAICYIDTLAVLTKDLPGWKGDKYYTRFCKYPGGSATAELSLVLKNSRYPNLQ